MKHAESMTVLEKPIAASDPEMADVIPAVGRILGEDPFRDSPQLSAFLKFVVEETINGRGKDLKGYTIATLALGRPDDFDPQLDPIVRVQAGRVRQALDEYYGAHRDEKIRIRLEKGSYAPRFLSVEKSNQSQHSDSQPIDAVTVQTRSVFDENVSVKTGVQKPPPAHYHSWLGLITVAILLLIAGLGAAGVFSPTVKSSSLTRASYFPIVVLERVIDPNGPAELAAIIQRTQDALARFDDILAVRDTQDIKRDSQIPVVSNRAERLTLRLSGAYADRGTIRFSARLIDQMDQAIIWVKEFDPVVTGTLGDDDRTEIVRYIATAIAQPYGVVHAYTRQVYAQLGKKPTDFGCLTLAFDYWLTSKRSTYLDARDCLIEQTDKNPGIASLHSQLAYLYLDEYRSGITELPKPPLDRAIAAANRGVNLAPNSARSYQSLMAVHFVRKEMESAWRAGEQARKLNPFDTDIQTDWAVRLIQAGQVEKGLAELDEALSLNPSPPDWATAYRSVGYYYLGNAHKARSIIRTMANSEFPLAMVGSILVSYQERNRPETMEKLAAFKKAHPLIFEDPKAYLDRINLDRKISVFLIARYVAALEWIGQSS